MQLRVLLLIFLFLSGQTSPLFQKEKYLTYEKAIRHAREDSDPIREKCRTANDGKPAGDPTWMEDVDKLRASRKGIFVESRFFVNIFVEVIFPACDDSFLAVLPAPLRCLRVRSARDIVRPCRSILFVSLPRASRGPPLAPRLTWKKKVVSLLPSWRAESGQNYRL